MAQDTYARLAGDKVELSAVSGAFKPCRYCGGRTAYVAEGVNHHAAALRCLSCDHHHAWLSRDHLAAMAAQKGAVA